MSLKSLRPLWRVVSSLRLGPALSSVDPVDCFHAARVRLRLLRRSRPVHVRDSRSLCATWRFPRHIPLWARVSVLISTDAVAAEQQQSRAPGVLHNYCDTWCLFLFAGRYLKPALRERDVVDGRQDWETSPPGGRWSRSVTVSTSEYPASRKVLPIYKFTVSSSAGAKRSGANCS